MNIKLFPQYEILLRFSLDNDAPLKYVERWNDLKKHTETANNKFLFKCFIDDNIHYRYLDRCEGGLELNGKQLRFRQFNMMNLDNDIKTQILSNWTFDELNYILKSFLKIFNETYDLGNGIRGTIELEPVDDDDE
jgi:hypothetical protein